MTAAIESEGLAKRFGRRDAVAGIDLHVPTSSIYAFLGQNGAGKTTAIRLILGLLRPTGGSVRVWGHDVASDRLRAARGVGSLVETPALYDRLTGRENLDLTRRMLGVSASEIDRVLDVVDLAGAGGRLAGGYSLGMRQRLGLARALLGRPRLLILDEPSNGLDPDGMRDMRALIRALPDRDGATVFVSSHMLGEVEQIATHVGLMHEGRLLAQSTLAEIKAGVRSLHAAVGEAERAAAALSDIGLSARATGDGDLQVTVPQGEDGASFAAAVNARLVERGFGVSRLGLAERTLEDVYLGMIDARRASSSQGA